MKIPVSFLVIYSIDLYKGDFKNLKREKPKCVRYPKWVVTEDKPNEKEIKTHRKYVAMNLSYQDLEEFINMACFDNVDQTMGSLTERGLLPALSFNIDTFDGYNNIFHNAYVSVVLSPETENKIIEEIDKRWGWESPQAKMFQEKIRNELDKRQERLNELVDDVEDDFREFMADFEIDLRQGDLFVEASK